MQEEGDLRLLFIFQSNHCMLMRRCYKLFPLLQIEFYWVSKWSVISSGLLHPSVWWACVASHQPMSAHYSSDWPITVQGWEAPSLEWWRGRWMGDRSEAISGWQCCYSKLIPPYIAHYWHEAPAPHIAHYWDEAPAPQWCKHSAQARGSARCWWHY